MRGGGAARLLLALSLCRAFHPSGWLRARRVSNESTRGRAAHGAADEAAFTLHEYTEETADGARVVIAAALGGDCARLKQFVEYTGRAAWDEARARSRTVDLAHAPTRAALREAWSARTLLVHGKAELDALMQSHSFEQQLAGCLRKVALLNATDDAADADGRTTREAVRAFVDREWGHARAAGAAFDAARPREVTLGRLKELLEWFRATFPYYHDGCEAEPLARTPSACRNREGNSFVGYVAPSAAEASAGRASRVELYACAACGALTRFARFGDVREVLRTKRGRCGEYSWLALRMLEGLGFETRWVVDMADHVWVEVRLEGAWVHVDPCEAAVDEPLLYEGWGKNLTTILSFDAYAPAPTVADVTGEYTTDIEGALRRREAEVTPARFDDLIRNANAELQEIGREAAVAN